MMMRWIWLQDIRSWLRWQNEKKSDEDSSQVQEIEQAQVTLLSEAL